MNDQAAGREVVETIHEPSLDDPESRALADRTMIVAGGTGNVGRVLVGQMLDLGATVVVPSRSKEKLEGLRGQVGGAGERLMTVEGDIGDEEEAPGLRDSIIGRVGPIDGAVASLGHFVPAPSVLEAPRADVQKALDGYLLAHLGVARTLIPALRERGGSYTFINGPLAFAPLHPGTGLVSIVTAAQAMLAQVTMAEMEGTPVRVNEVVVHTPFGWSDKDEQRGVVRQHEVGRYVALLASPLGAEIRNRTIHLNSREVLGGLFPATD